MAGQGIHCSAITAIMMSLSIRILQHLLVQAKSAINYFRFQFSSSSCIKRRTSWFQCVNIVSQVKLIPRHADHSSTLTTVSQLRWMFATNTNSRSTIFLWHTRFIFAAKIVNDIWRGSNCEWAKAWGVEPPSVREGKEACSCGNLADRRIA